MEIKSTFDTGIMQGMTPARQAQSDFARMMSDKADAAEKSPNVSSSSLPIRTDKSSAQIQKEIKDDPQRKKLFDASVEFQAIFLGQMLSAMRKNLKPGEDLLGGGRTREIFEDFLYDEYAKNMSKAPGFNLADEIYKQMSANLGPTQTNALPTGVSTEQTSEKPGGF